MTISIINGPNLNMLGKRNPEIYGHETFEETLTGIRKKFPETEIRFFQSNSEGEIIDMIQRENADPAVAGIVLNPGAYAHYSFAIADAVADSDTPVAAELPHQLSILSISGLLFPVCECKVTTIFLFHQIF